MRDEFAVEEPSATARTVTVGAIRVEIREPAEFVGHWLRRSDTVAVRLPLLENASRSPSCRRSACDVAIVVLTLVAILCLPIILNALIVDVT